MSEMQDRRPTRFPELVVAGSDEAIGLAIGEHFRERIRELCAIVLERFNKSAARPVTQAEADAVVAAGLPFAEAFLPGAMTELRATARAAGLSLHDLMLLNLRSILAAPAPSAEGCTSVMVGASLAAGGVGFAGQNWDNDPAMDAFSAVVTRKPEGRPAFMTWCQPGVIAYMGMSEAGMGLCLNSLNGPSRRDGVGWYFLVRALYEKRSVDEILAMFRGTRGAMSGNAAMITPEGPLDLEVTLNDIGVMRAGPDGWLVHTNHCLHERLLENNERHAAAIYGHSFERQDRASALMAAAVTASGRISVEDAMTILSDREGHPTAINRYPSDHPRVGWQRTVISMIVEPDAGRMHVARGNPGDNPYELYTMR